MAEFLETGGIADRSLQAYRISITPCPRSAKAENRRVRRTRALEQASLDYEMPPSKLTLPARAIHDASHICRTRFGATAVLPGADRLRDAVRALRFVERS